MTITMTTTMMMVITFPAPRRYKLHPWEPAYDFKDDDAPPPGPGQAGRALKRTPAWSSSIVVCSYSVSIY